MHKIRVLSKIKIWISLLTGDYFAVGKTDAKFILGVKRIARR